MRSRLWALGLLLLLLVSVAACGASSDATPTEARPARTLRPTFTVTPVRTKGVVLVPTATRLPTMTVAVAAAEPTSEAPAPATATPTVAAKAMLTANSTVNVRRGPGTNYSVVGQITQGQQFEITGKNNSGDWWQFSYQGQDAWVIGRLVTGSGPVDGVQVAASIPAAPTSVPVAAAPVQQQPAQPEPTQPPAAPPAKYAVLEMTPRYNTNDIITVRCRLAVDLANGIAGTLRLTQGGNTLGEQSFSNILVRANTGMSLENQYIYNDGCKIEIPFVEGTYTGYIVEGGQPVSDPITFTASGTDREFVLTWHPR